MTGETPSPGKRYVGLIKDIINHTFDGDQEAHNVYLTFLGECMGKYVLYGLEDREFEPLGEIEIDASDDANDQNTKKAINEKLEYACKLGHEIGIYCLENDADPEMFIYAMSPDVVDKPFEHDIKNKNMN